MHLCLPAKFSRSAERGGAVPSAAILCCCPKPQTRGDPITAGPWVAGGTWRCWAKSQFLYSLLPGNHENPISPDTRSHVRVGNIPGTHCIVVAATDCQYQWLALVAVASVVSFFRGWGCPNVIAKIEYEACGRECAGVRANQLTAGRGIDIYQTDHGLMDDTS